MSSRSSPFASPAHGIVRAEGEARRAAEECEGPGARSDEWVPETCGAGSRDARTAGILAAGREALALLLPLRCAGCTLPGIELCARCRAEFRPLAVERYLGSGLSVHGALPFAGAPAAAMRAFKRDGRTSLARVMAPALALALEAAAGAAPQGALAAVPVPSSRASYRRRGYAPVELLLRRAGVPPCRALRAVRSPRDQRGLGRAERERNVQGAFRIRRGETGIRDVVLVDDVVTTGATLRSAAAVLRGAGIRVWGAAVVNFTQTREDA